MHKINVEINDKLNEKVYRTKLSNGLDIYICKKENYERKVGLFGTKYGSLISDFVDSSSNKRVNVPNGIAHFLEHKLFEMEDENALDLFSRIGVDSNAYTSYDQTVFYFETVDKFEDSIKLLIKLIKEPYFTVENVEKEQGIISQEILMGEDDPDYILYFKTLEALYLNSNVKIDIAGTVDSIRNITPELLYTCYKTFYNLNNMFFIVVGDVDVEKTISIIEETLKKYDNKKEEKINIFNSDEPLKVNKKEIITNMEFVNIPKLCLGYKLPVVEGIENIKRCVISDIVDIMYFSRLSKFFKDEYDKRLIIEPLSFEYEGNYDFSHVLISTDTTNEKVLENDLKKYIEKIKKEEIDIELFNKIKNRNLGVLLMESDRLSNGYKRIIDSILENTDIYDDINILENIEIKDIYEFLNLLDEELSVVSIVKSKGKS